MWEIPVSYSQDMHVPARVFATREMLKDVVQDKSLEQLVNVASLPGVQQAAIVMPDVHEGYGFPIGGIAATRYPDGVISPGGIGYDINCGVRLLKTNFTYSDIRPYATRLAGELYKKIPSGMGKGGPLKMTDRDLDSVLNEGAPYIVQRGFGTEEDIHLTESFGRLEWAEAGCVSEQARTRGRDQLGTMGSGNHFVEVDRVDAVFDDETAEIYGLELNQIVVLIHTGSRGMGHQIATDYIRRMMPVMEQYNIRVKDRELACAPFSSKEGTQYFKAMAAAANFAWCNRQVITANVRRAFEAVLGSTSDIHVVYDVAHNIAKIEEHEVNGERMQVIVHRKGATRAFPPGHDDVVEEYRSAGQPVIIPGSMGTASYVLAGATGSMLNSFGSTCHGAGRRMSRRQATKEVRGDELLKELNAHGIVIQAGSMRGLAEEAPAAYKDVHSVVDVVDEAGIARKIARLRPVAVIKG